MDSYFFALGATIVADFPTLPPSLQVFHHPAKYYPERSRTLFHETLHFWQYLASGYLTRLVEDDWVRLANFEKSGVYSMPSARREHFLSKHVDHGFSPQDLMEAFARFWDIQVVGPPELIAFELAAGGRGMPPQVTQRFEQLRREGRLRHPRHGGYSWESFELAMEGPGRQWSKPFVMLRQKYPPKAVGALFPVAVNLALQTEDPVGTFMFLISGGPSLEAALPGNIDVADAWRWAYKFLYPLLLELPAGQLIGNGIKAAAAGPLAENPLWDWLIKYMLRAAAEFGAGGEENLDREKAVLRGISHLSFALSCPGELRNRGMLARFLAPPLVRFSDGVTWNVARDAAASVGASASSLATTDAVAGLAGEMGERWQRFMAARGY